MRQHERDVETCSKYLMRFRKHQIRVPEGEIRGAVFEKIIAENFQSWLKV